MAVKKDLNQLKTQLASKTPTATALNDTTSGINGANWNTPLSQPTDPASVLPSSVTAKNIPALKATPAIQAPSGLGAIKPTLNPVSLQDSIGSSSANLKGRAAVTSDDYLSYLTDLAARNKSNLTNGVYAPLTQSELTNVEAQAARDAYRAKLNNGYNSPSAKKATSVTDSPAIPALSNRLNASKKMTTLSGVNVGDDKNNPTVPNAFASPGLSVVKPTLNPTSLGGINPLAEKNYTNEIKPQFDGLDYGVNRVPAVDEDYLKYLKQTVSGNKYGSTGDIVGIDKIYKLPGSDVDSDGNDLALRYGSQDTFNKPWFDDLNLMRPLGTLSQDDIINIEAQAVRDNYRAYLNNVKATAKDRRNEITAQAVGLDTPSLGLGATTPVEAVNLQDSNYGVAKRKSLGDLGSSATPMQAVDLQDSNYSTRSMPSKEAVAAANKLYNNGISPQDTQNRLLAQAAALFANKNNQQFTQEDTAKIISGDYSPLENFYNKRYNGAIPFDIEEFGKSIKQTDMFNVDAIWGADTEKIASALMNAYYQTNGYPSSSGTAVSPAITYNNDYRVTAPNTQTDKFATDFGNLSGNATPYDPKAAAAPAEALSQTTKPDSGKGDDGKGGDKGDNGGSGNNGGSGDNGGTGAGGTGSGGSGGVGGYGISGDIGQYLLNFSDRYYKESQKYLDEVMETMKKEGKNQQNQLEKTLGETLFDLQKQRAANNAAAFTTNANVGALTAGNVQADQASARELSKSADTYYNNLQTLLYQLQSSKNNWSTNRWGWIYDALGDYMYGAMGSQAAAQIGLQQALAEIAASKNLQAEQNKWIESHPEFYPTQS